MYKLLFIEDEIDLGNVIKQYLEITGFQVEWFKNGKEAFDAITHSSSDYDLIILDVSIPEMDGFELAEHINNINSKTPFIFLTARAEKADKIKGLKIGADDYITKPFDIDELVLRIKNIIKRKNNNTIAAKEKVSEVANVIKSGNITFDKSQLKLSIGAAKPVILTLRECELLEYFFQNKNKILKREELLVNLWGKNDYFLGRSLDVFVSRLRKYLGPAKHIKINNIYGIGFIFSVEDGNTIPERN